jgi:hypothetical protein
MGRSIAMAVDVFVIGAPSDSTYCDKGYFGAGKAYICRFDRDSGRWGDLEELVPSITGCHRGFGRSMSVSGNRVVVGAQEPWMAHVFEFDANSLSWSEVATLVPPPRGDGTNFARSPASVDLDGDTAIVGAYSSWISGTSAGAAFIYQRTAAGEWIQREVLLPHQSFSSFGHAVAIADGRIFVGGHAETNLSGAAYIYDLHPPMGDVTCDGVVDIDDLFMLLGGWGHCPLPGETTTGCPADLNTDGVVDVFDLLILLDNLR